MKTLTTMTAIMALIAGVSIASAQNSTSTEKAPPPASINKGSLPNSHSGDQKMNPSAKTGMQSGAQKNGRVAAGNSKFCVETTPGGALDCKFASMAACEKEGKPQNHLCKPNPNLGTTGSKQ